MPSNTFERTRQQIKQGDAKVSIKDDLKFRQFKFLVAYHGIIVAPLMKNTLGPPVTINLILRKNCVTQKLC